MGRMDAGSEELGSLHYQHIPVVMLSVGTTASEVRGCYVAGVADFLKSLRCLRVRLS